MKISVITPIYNASKYIERCVRSLMEQTITDGIEFVFVNDCTPDDSMEVLARVLTEYPMRKGQVHIINNERNLGPSDSRKIAFRAAKGKYIACCDADDWTEREMYMKMYEASCNGEKDIVVCNYRTEEGEKSRNGVFTPSPSPQEALSMMHDRRRFPYAMWNQLIKRTLILEEIEHIIPTRIREDTYLLMRIYYHARDISFVSGIYYHYFYEDESSLVHSFDDSYEAWLIQKENMERISLLLYSDEHGYEKYHRGMNIFKFARKLDYRNAFNSLHKFYKEYRETHADFIAYDSRNYSYPKMAWLKMKFVYDTNFAIFWLYNKLMRHGK